MNNDVNYHGDCLHMKEGLETVCSHGQGKTFSCDLISVSISQQTHFSWLVIPSGSTCLSYHEVWISGIEIKKGGKNYDISAGQETLRSHWTFYPRVCLTIQGSSILSSIIPPMGELTLSKESLSIFRQIYRSFLQPSRSLIDSLCLSVPTGSPRTSPSPT